LRALVSLTRLEIGRVIGDERNWTIGLAATHKASIRVVTRVAGNMFSFVGTCN
jgi:hypothetical protein